MPPNGPVLQRVIAALERMGSGYVPILTPGGAHVAFVHQSREPFTLPRGPQLTVGQAWATLAERIDMAEFLKHYRPDEPF